MSDSDRIAALESQVAQLMGQEQTLHPHGNRTNDRRGANPVELLNENISRLFAKVAALEKRLDGIKSWKDELRPGKNITINGNVISAADPIPPLPPALINVNVCDPTTGVATPYNLWFQPSVGGAP